MILRPLRQGWHFVAAKLRREGGAALDPHPLGLTFKTQQPVYPMRMTALSGSPVALELFVVAERGASAPGLTTEFRDLFLYKGSYVRSSRYPVSIAHPRVGDVMWPGSWLTRLSAVLGPEEMGKDLVIRLDSGRPHRRRLYSREGAGLRALEAGCQFWCLVVPVVVLWAYGATAREEGRRQFLVRGLLPALALSQFVVVVSYAILPKTEVFTRSGDDYLNSSLVTPDLSQIVGEEVAKGTPFDGIRERLRDHLAVGRIPNRLLGGQMREEDSPGNYTLHESPVGIELRAYEHSGDYTRWLYPREPAGRSD